MRSAGVKDRKKEDAAEAAARDAFVIFTDIDEQEETRKALLQKRSAGGLSHEALLALIDDLRVVAGALVSAAVETLKL